jgi:prolipoprotein diacylglyceryltransferase
MLIHPNFDPVAFSLPVPFIGTLAVRWYGLM